MKWICVTHTANLESVIGLCIVVEDKSSGDCLLELG